MWSDNGRKNKGKVLDKLLLKEKIYPVFIEPGNPQQKGKIERFWLNINHCTNDVSETG